MEIRLSKSQMLEYLQCPKKWFFDYKQPYKVRNNTIIINDLEFPRSYDIEDENDGIGLKHVRPEPAENTPLRIGIELHEIFEKFYNIPEAMTIKKPYEQNIYNLLMTMENAWKYEDQIKNFANFNAQIITLDKGPKNYHPVSVEQSIYNKQLNFIGIIDRVDRSEDGEYSIIDYKTGKMHPPTNYLLELSLYAIIYEKETGRSVNRAGIYFSKNNRLRMIEITPQNKREALTVLQQVRKNIKKSIKNNNDFEKKHAFLCKYCDFKDICARVE